MTDNAFAQQPAADLSLSQAQVFITRTFGWMTLGLAVTAVVAAGLAQQQEWLNWFEQHTWAWVGLIVAQFALVIAIAARVDRMPALAGQALFMLYSALMGVMMGVIVSMYTTASIAATFAVSASMFAGVGLWGWVTKKDLTKMGTVCIMALIGLIVASIVNIFFASSTLYWIITYAGVLIFCGLTAYDFQKLRRVAQTNPDPRNAIRGALMLYLDFINLFLFLLRIFGSAR